MTGEPSRDEKGDVLYSMGGSNEGTFVISDFTGATEIMLTNVRAVSHTSTWENKGRIQRGLQVLEDQMK